MFLYTYEGCNFAFFQVEKSMLNLSRSSVLTQKNRRKSLFIVRNQHKSNFQLVLYTIEYICNSIPIWSFAFPAAEYTLYPFWFYYPLYKLSLSLFFICKCNLNHYFIIFLIGKNIESYSNLNTSVSLKNIIQFGIQAYTFSLLFNHYLFQNPDTFVSLIHNNVTRDFLTTTVAYVSSNHLT